MSSLARAAVFLGANQPLQIQQGLVPSARPDEVVVETLGCTLCGSDVHSRFGRRKVATPTILGHEILGKVVSFGEGVPPVDARNVLLSIGDRVTWAIVANCGGCHYCHRELPQKCERAFKYGHEVHKPTHAWSGGLASHCVLVPHTSIFKVPAELDSRSVLPANCATATTAAALRAAGAIHDRIVLVMGAGMLGLTACAMASARGAAAVICCDVQPQRRELALAFGATAVTSPEELAVCVRQASSGYGADAVLEMSGATVAMASALEVLGIGGVLVEVGAVFPVAELHVLPENLVRRQWTLRGVHNYAPQDLSSALQFLQENPQFPFASLVSAQYSLDEIDQAFTVAASGQHLRVAVAAN